MPSTIYKTIKILLFIAYALAALFFSIIIYDQKPQTEYSQHAPILLGISVAVLFPGILNLLTKRFRPSFRALTTTARILISVSLLFYVTSGIGENEKKRYSLMTPDERVAEVKRKSEAEEARRLAGLSSSIEQEKKDEALSRIQKIKAENDAQEGFYQQLSAPKLLYRCKESKITKAIGAKSGTYNSLLEDAIHACGIDRLVIIKNDKK